MRIYLFITMSVYGWGKVANNQFFIRGHVPEAIARKTLVEATAHDIAWVFFGYSQAYLWFIGLSQALSAILLLFEKTRLLGVAILIPILVNVIVVDICYGVSPGPLMSAIIYLILVGIILYLNRKTVGEILQAFTSISIPAAGFIPKWNKNLAVILGIMALIALTETSVFLYVHFNIRQTKEFWFFH